MIEYTYDGTLEGLFAILDRICRSESPEAMLPNHVRRPLETAQCGNPDQEPTRQPDLFGTDSFGNSPHDAGPGPAAPNSAMSDTATLSPPAALFSVAVYDAIPDIPVAQYLCELSANAYGHFIHGWMSELSIEAALIRFAWKVLAAGRNAPGGVTSPEAREAAEAAAVDRGDPDVHVVLTAAYKVWKELDRFRGLLRFSPDASGVHIAHCKADHYVLPGLAGHFTLRFGETPWAIIDERRGLALIRFPGEDARIIAREDLPHSIAVTGHEDPWENLWINYHRAVANESRLNPRLQRQFMPKRYWKYLPEL
ncbi:hypothetical protein AGMMS49944_01370 [Spirochaetia bacterium]|nr:hypothetical protein AGMMS49944_01370 [Spirochaetia bacterium]